MTDPTHQEDAEIDKALGEDWPGKGYAHPKSIPDFEAVYRREHQDNLANCDRWIEWCKKDGDFFGVNFHQGMRSAHVFNDIKMWQLIRILKGEPPNV